MKCENCQKEISNDMRGALAHNSCPWCSSSIMSSEKAEQYFNLIQLLDQTPFTNRQDVDAQIRAKVATLMVSNFIFMQIASPIEEDVIVLDEPKQKQSNLKSPPFTKLPTPLPSTKMVNSQIIDSQNDDDDLEGSPAVQKVDSRGRPMNTITEADLGNLDDSELKSIPMNTKPRPSVSPSGKKLTAQDYARIQDDVYESADTPPMPVSSSDDLAGNLQKDLQRLQKYQSVPKGLSGQGIKRV